MDHSEIEHESVLKEHPPKHFLEPDAQSHSRRARHQFLSFLSFCGAAILSLAFLTAPLGDLAKWLMLLGAVSLGMLGILLREQLPTQASDPDQSQEQSTTQHSGQVALVSHAEKVEQDKAENLEVLSEFEQLVQEALNSIPEAFHEEMDNVAVFVEDQPDMETLTRLGISEGYLLGLYQGNPLTRRPSRSAFLPEHITLYQKNIERYCHGDPAAIREQVRRTLLHEVAHHFGIDHEEMPIWVK